YSITFAAPATTVTSTYQWEDSTNNGIADFTKSATRTAGQGFIFRQDNGGKIQNVKTYNDIQYCLHEFNTWKLDIGSDDTLATNRIFREASGIPNWRAAVSTGEGIYFIDDSNIGNPQFRLLTLDISSSEVKPTSKSLNIDLSDYLFDKATAEEFGDYILFECRTSDSTENNRTIVYDKLWNLWTVLDYCFTCKTTNNGELWVGDSLTANVYKLLSGTDDDDSTIDNYFESNLDNLEIQNLKKVKRLRLKGEIQKNQSYRVYLSFDKSGFVEVGNYIDDEDVDHPAIEGSGSYVDAGTPITVGNTTVGTKKVGSGDVLEAYSYFRELSINTDKFQEVKIKFVAVGIGYVSISEYTYKDTRIKENRIPKKYRS
ncbi:MAG: hypothetical protein NTY75_05145, partial [Candidatus Shapirobacteria bacterium]|nr:hypothetical protein [Candidatus Shapirobacteria bacterium]